MPKGASISLFEVAKRAKVSYPTAMRYKQLGNLDPFIANPDEEHPRKIRYKPSTVKELIRLRNQGNALRGIRKKKHVTKEKE